MTTVDPMAAQAAAARPVKPVLKIRPRSGWIGVNAQELWRFRDLLWSLVGRDIKLRYKQTALGVTWVVLQPLISAGILTFVFGSIAKMPTENTTAGKAIPYFLFSFAGMVAWTLFSATINKVSIILVGNSALVSKVYFPRLLLPISGAAGSLVDLAVGLAMLVVIQFAAGIPCGPQVLLAPIVIALFIAMSLGVGMWSGALMVEYRDVGQIMPVVIGALMYASPVAYSASRVDKYQTLYYLNPVSGLLGAWRWSVMSAPLPPLWAVFYAAGMSIAVLLIGTLVFRRKERMFADVI